MEPRISSVNREHPIGKLVGLYGDDRYWQGFADGVVVGTSFTVCVLAVLVMLKQSP